MPHPSQSSDSLKEGRYRASAHSIRGKVMLLAQRGPVSSADIARKLSITQRRATLCLHKLKRLLVCVGKQQPPRGAPLKLWRLSGLNLPSA